MTFANPLPWWALGGLLIAAALVAALAYRTAPLAPAQRGVLSAARFASLVFLVLLLMRPVTVGPADAGEVVVPILVDVSRSMSIEDAGGMRRIDRAREEVAAMVPALGTRFRTELLTFGEALAPAGDDGLVATARRSDLAAALRSARERYRGRAVAGLVLLSDGGETGGGEAPAAGGPPVFAMGIGSRRAGRDREVLSVTAAEAVLDDSRTDLAVSAVSHGYGLTPIELRLLENGRVIDVRRVTPAVEGSPIREVFEVVPGPGAAAVYGVEIPAAGDELVPENNRRSVLVRTPARPRRALLVQGAPGFEGSFLRRAWSGDTGLQVDSVVRKGKNEQGSDTFYIQAPSARSASLASGFPASREHLFAYDALILANVDASTLTRAHLEGLREFVGRRGGGLLVLGAQSFLRGGAIDTPLEELVPLDLTDRGRGVLPAADGKPAGANRVSLTPAGEFHPIMQLTAAGGARTRWADVPALAATAPLGGPRPGATVLAVAAAVGGTSRALVAVQRYGEGRSMVFTGEGAWRWRMLLPASDRTYETFWRQALRWLALPAADPISITTAPDAAPGDLLTIRVAARDAGFEPLQGVRVDVRVTRPDGRIDAVAAAPDTSGGSDGSFVGRYRAELPGVHRIAADVRRGEETAGTASAAALVGGADPEMADPRLNLQVLQRIASVSGGRTIEPGEVDALVAGLRAGVPAATLLVGRDLWHNAWSFLAIVGLLAAEWLLRRRWGLR